MLYFLCIFAFAASATRTVDYIKDTDHTHEVGLFVQSVYDAGGSAVVEVTVENVSMGEVWSRQDRWHDLDDQDHCQYATTAQWTTQWMYDRHKPTFVQH